MRKVVLECLIPLFLSPTRMWFLFSGEGRPDKHEGSRSGLAKEEVEKKM